jgi:hypothetical protein
VKKVEAPSKNPEIWPITVKVQMSATSCNVGHCRVILYNSCCLDNTDSL